MDNNFQQTLVEKKKSVSGTPSKNDLKNMQKHNADYNKKHPHSLAPMVKKDAGNVELNNQRFNNSVDFSRLKAADVGTPFIGDATDAEVSAASAGGESTASAGAGDGGGAGGEALSISQAWERLDEAEVLDEVSLRDLMSKAKDVSNKVKDVATQAKNVVSKTINAPANGILYLNNDGSVRRSEDMPATALRSGLADLQKRVKKTAEVFDGVGQIYRDGKLIYSTDNSSKSVDSMIIVEFEHDREGNKEEINRYYAIKYGKEKDQIIGDASKKILNISNISSTSPVNNTQDIYRNLYLYAQSKNTDNNLFSYQVLSNGNKLDLDTYDLTRTQMGKMISNDAKAKEAALHKKKPVVRDGVGKYSWVLIEVTNYTTDKPKFSIESSGKFETEQKINYNTKISSIPQLKDIQSVSANSKVPYICEVYWYGNNTPIVVYNLGGAVTQHFRWEDGVLQAGHLPYDHKSDVFSNGKKSYTLGDKSASKGDTKKTSQKSDNSGTSKNTASGKSKSSSTPTQKEQIAKVKSITGDTLDDAKIKQILAALRK